MIRFDGFRNLRFDSRFESIAFGIEDPTSRFDSISLGFKIRFEIRDSIPSIRDLDSISDTTESYIAFFI